MSALSITIIVLCLSAQGFTIAWAACVAAKKGDEIMAQALETKIPLEPASPVEDQDAFEAPRDNRELAKWLKFHGGVS